MAGLWRNDEKTREGKYPVLLRRDGTVPEWEWFVLGSRDPASIAAIHTYADEADLLGWDPQYIADLRDMAESWRIGQSSARLARLERIQAARHANDDQAILSELQPTSVPDAPPHRTDDPEVLSFPSSLAAYREQLTGGTAIERLRRVLEQVKGELSIEQVRQVEADVFGQETRSQVLLHGNLVLKLGWKMPEPPREGAYPCVEINNDGTVSCCFWWHDDLPCRDEMPKGWWISEPFHHEDTDEARARVTSAYEALGFRIR